MARISELNIPRIETVKPERDDADIKTDRNMNHSSKENLEGILVRTGMTTAEQMQDALQIARRDDKTVEQVLIEKELLNPHDLATAVSIELGVPLIDLKRHRVHPIQTVDEHCMVIRRESGIRFDEKVFNGFHFYGPDLCLTAASKGLMNFGILNPLVHDSASGSLVSGKREFMRLLNALAKKWRPTFPFIRTPTSIIRRRSVRTFVRFTRK